jgi:predicted RNA-binding Zn-ribbon protein involved in translation (DUF1610 family)
MPPEIESTAMGSSSQTSEPTRSRRSERRKRPALPRARRLWQDWWVEIVVGVLILLAIFLLVEQMNIRETLYAWLLAAIDGLESLIATLARGVVHFVQGTTLSDLVAYLLILVVVVLIAWRTRYRILTNPRLAQIQCPRCGGDLHRIHRRWYHRLLNVVIPSRRYGCKDPACGWRGLRVKRSD